MKPLLLFVFCIVSTSVFAQNDDSYAESIHGLLKKFKGTNNDSLQKQLQNYFKQRGISNNLLSNLHENMATLPQDRMPCLVSDTKNIVKIPNAWNAATIPYIPQYHRIPNPALPKMQSLKWNALDNSLKIQTK